MVDGWPLYDSVKFCDPALSSINWEDCCQKQLLGPSLIMKTIKGVTSFGVCLYFDIVAKILAGILSVI